MGKKITDDIIVKINELYAKNCNYSATAKQLGISPSTVKKYVQKNIDFNQPRPQQKEITHVNLNVLKRRIENFVLPFEKFNDPFLLTMTEQEKHDIKLLWEELTL